MTATITNLSAIRQARGLPAIRPVPVCRFRKGDRIRVLSRGRCVTYVTDLHLNAMQTDWVLTVVIDGRRIGVEARDCVHDGGEAA